MNDHLLTTLKNIPLCHDYPNRKCREQCACEVITMTIAELQANSGLRALHALLLGLLMVIGTLAYIIAMTPTLPSPEPIAAHSLPLAPLALLDLPPSPLALVDLPPSPLVPVQPRKAKTTRHYDQNTMNLPCRTSVNYGICNR